MGADWLVVDEFEKIANLATTPGIWKEIEVIVKMYHANDLTTPYKMRRTQFAVDPKNQYTAQLGEDPPETTPTHRTLWRPIMYEGRRKLSETDLLFVARMQEALQKNAEFVSLALLLLIFKERISQNIGRNFKTSLLTMNLRFPSELSKKL